jgi:hypothetical protein
MDIEIRPISPGFVAEIGGIDLSKSIDRPAVDAIWANRPLCRAGVSRPAPRRHAIARLRG